MMEHWACITLKTCDFCTGFVLLMLLVLYARISFIDPMLTWLKQAFICNAHDFSLTVTVVQTHVCSQAWNVFPVQLKAWGNFADSKILKLQPEHHYSVRRNQRGRTKSDMHAAIYPNKTSQCQKLPEVTVCSAGIPASAHQPVLLLLPLFLEHAIFFHDLAHSTQHLTQVTFILSITLPGTTSSPQGKNAMSVGQIPVPVDLTKDIFSTGLPSTERKTCTLLYFFILSNLRTCPRPWHN